MSATDTLTVSGSEAAAAIGVDPYCTPVQLWTRKLGLEVERPESEAMKWGKLLEPVIVGEVVSAGYLADPIGDEPVTSDQYPHLTGHPDRYIERGGRRGILEVKTTSSYRRGEWDDDQVPPHVFVQGTVYMMLTGLEWCLAACLIGGQQLVLREFELDAGAAEIIATRTAEFLRYVEDQVPPPPRAGDSGLLYPAASGETVQLTPETYALCKRREELRKQAAELERQQGEADELIKLALGEASAGMFEGRRVVSWGEVTRKGYSVEGKTYRQFRVMP